MTDQGNFGQKSIVVSSTYPSQSCISPGDEAPNFTADAYTNGRQREIQLEDYRGKWVVLIFYSGDFTFV